MTVDGLPAHVCHAPVTSPAYQRSVKLLCPILVALLLLPVSARAQSTQGAETDSEADSEADSDADSGSDSEADSDAETDVDAEADADVAARGEHEHLERAAEGGVDTRTHPPGAVVIHHHHHHHHPPEPDPQDDDPDDGVEPEEDTEPNPLVPRGETRRMGAHPVEPSGIRFVPGKGLEVNSADGEFRLQTRVRVQFRWTGERVDEEDWEHQFRIRRARVVFSGHAFSEDIAYKLELAISPNDVGIRDNYSDDPLDRRPLRSPLLDFYVDFKHLRDLQVRVGQYKIPSNRQRVISSGNLQLVDRALLNGEFTLDRDVGFDLRSRDFLGIDLLRYYLGVYIARGRDSQGLDDFGLMYLARIEVLPLGLFSDYTEVDFERGPPRLSLGFGWAHIDRARSNRGILGSAPADGGTTDTQHIFADALFMARGFSALTEVAWRRGDRNPGNALDEMGVPIPVELPRDGVGFHIQAGYLLPKLPFEVAARYGFVRGIGDTSLRDGNELLGAFSYYPGQHPYKVQIDYARLWGDEISQGEHRIRLQLQVSL